MKLINKLFILSLSLTIGLSSCGIWDQPAYEKIENENKNKEDQKEDEKDNDKEDQQPEVNPFDGYTFVLDRSQIPRNGNYNPETDVPPAKLMAFDDKGEFIRDVLAENKIEVQLGFDSDLQRVGDYLFIFAGQSSLKDNLAKSVATVLDARTLQKVNQTSYSSNGLVFIIGATPNKAFIGDIDSNISVLDLKTGSVSHFVNTTARLAAGVFYDGTIFVSNDKESAITWYDINDATNTGKIELDKRVSRIFKISDDMLFVNTDSSKTSYLVSLKTKDVKKKLPFNLNHNKYFLNSVIYDAKSDRLYFSGAKGYGEKNKDKIFYCDLSQENPMIQLFYTVPAKDINMSKGFSGKIMMGINHDRDEMYIGHLDTDDFVRRPNGLMKAIHIGYLSKITDLTNKALPITKPDAKVEIKEMGDFSSFFSF